MMIRGASVLFTLKNRKFWLGNQRLRVNQFGKFCKLWASGWGDTLFFTFQRIQGVWVSFEPFSSSVNMVQPSSVMICLPVKFPTGWFV